MCRPSGVTTVTSSQQPLVVTEKPALTRLSPLSPLSPVSWKLTEQRHRRRRGVLLTSQAVHANSAIESGTMLVTPVTLVTAAEITEISATGRDVVTACTPVTAIMAWDDLDHWRFRLGRAGASRDARLQRGSSIGVVSGRRRCRHHGRTDRLTLPTDLTTATRCCELKRLARDLGVMPKVVFPVGAADAFPRMATIVSPANLPDDFGKNGGV